jgi:modulator of FtsH protease HflK
MSRLLKLTIAAAGLWLLTGVYIVGGNERAAVRRFGRALTDQENRIVLKQSGLHYDWPWPFSRVDRIHLNEIRTLKTPLFSSARLNENELLGESFEAAPACLTGDQNLVNLQMAVQYRVDLSSVGRFLYGSVSLEDRLSALAQSVATEWLAQSGVDYVQVSGQAAWRKELARRLEERALANRLGVLIEGVTLDQLSPPVEVKADFLDVANARADREQLVQSALSAADGRRRSAEAEAREIRDAAQSEARQTVQAAQGSADRFLEIVSPFQADTGSPDSPDRKLARRLAMERYYHQTLAEILNKVKGQVFLDTGQPIDLTILKPGKSNAAKPRNKEVEGPE